jgi:poly-gamma-glutamate system protein
MMQAKLYWRPSRIPGKVLLLILLAATAALLIVESFKENRTGQYYDEMLQASRLMKRGIETIRPIRAKVNPIDPELDPLRSGLIGIASSPVTSNSGHLVAKRATINPNWAAVVVRMLSDAGVQPGDKVAVAVSGSFPALNLAVYSAIQVMNLDAVIIASGSASQWGANIPGMLWIDMSRELRDAGVLNVKETAASLGAEEDRGIGLPRDGIRSIRKSIEKAGVPLLFAENREASVSERMAIYREGATRPIKVLINVGGGSATTGPDAIDHYFDTGVSRSVRARAFAMTSVMGQFLTEGIPVINLAGIKGLSARYGLPYPPLEPQGIGSGGVYHGESYRRWLAGLMIAMLLALTAFVMRSAHIALVAESGDSRPTTLKPKV